MAQLLDEGELGQVGHALRIQHPVQMVAFMLHHPGMKIASLALDPRAVEAEAGIAYAGRAGHQTGETGNRQAGLPAGGGAVSQNLDYRRSEERRVGEECVSTCNARGSASN